MIPDGPPIAAALAGGSLTGTTGRLKNAGKRTRFAALPLPPPNDDVAR